MKGHKGNRKHREEGGVVDKDDAPSDVYAGKGSNVEKEAKERKAGGRIARKGGGPVGGAPAAPNAGRTPRKSGGGLFSAAAKGTKPAGHMTMKAEC